jgi:hypothetical protein
MDRYSRHDIGAGVPEEANRVIGIRHSVGESLSGQLDRSGQTARFYE